MPPAVFCILGLFLGVNARQGALELGLGDGEITVLVLEGLQAVSYTHLDVYKRQA